MKLRVELYLFTKREGGRSSGIESGYRPDFDWGARENGVMHLAGARIDLTRSSRLEPGQSSLSYLRPFHPEYWRHLTPGNILAVREGARQVGSARILDIEPDA